VSSIRVSDTLAVSVSDAFAPALVNNVRKGSRLSVSLSTLLRCLLSTKSNASNDVTDYGRIQTYLAFAVFPSFCSPMEPAWAQKPSDEADRTPQASSARECLLLWNERSVPFGVPD